MRNTNDCKYIFSTVILLLLSLDVMTQTTYYRVIGGIPHLPVFSSTGSVSSPAAGMVIYSTGNACPMLYTGSAWVDMCTSSSFTANAGYFKIVNGIPVFPVKSSVSGSQVIGSVYLSSSSSGVLQVYNGSSWADVDAISGLSASSGSRMNAELKLPVLASAPTVSGLSAGAIYLSSADNTLYWYTGSAWQGLVCNLPPVASGLSITGTLKSYSSVSASYTYTDADGDPQSGTTFQWYRATSSGGAGAVAISGATSSSYTLTTTDVGYYMGVKVTPKASSGLSPGTAVTVYSTSTVQANVVPVASGLSISGTLNNYGVLSVTYTYTDADGDSQSGTTFQWYRATSSTGTGATAISGATGTTYTLTTTDVGYYIGVKVTPKAASGASPGTAVTKYTTSTVSLVAPDGTLVVELTSSSGQVWMDRNLGATRAATASDDYQAYGSLFQWCRAADGHQLITWTSSTAGTVVNGTTSTQSTTTSPGDSKFITGSSDWLQTAQQDGGLWWNGTMVGANNPCPAGYHVPTYAEWDAEVSAGISNDATAYSKLKLPVAGFRIYSNGSLNNTGYYGYFWSSSVDGTAAFFLSFYSSNAFLGSYNRAFGFSVRCIKDY